MLTEHRSRKELLKAMKALEAHEEDDKYKKDDSMSNFRKSRGVGAISRVWNTMVKSKREMKYWLTGGTADAQRNEESPDGLSRRAREKMINRAMMVTFLLYPLLLSTVFTMFRCRPFDNDESYLMEDLSINCNGSQRPLWKGLAYFFMAIYPVGIPLTFSIILYKNQKSLNPKMLMNLKMKLRAASFPVRGQKIEEHMHTFDVDGDGKLKLAEFMSAVRSLTFSEQAMRMTEEEMETVFMALDKDHDEQVTPKEYADFLQRGWDPDHTELRIKMRAALFCAKSHQDTMLKRAQHVLCHARIGAEDAIEAVFGSTLDESNEQIINEEQFTQRMVLIRSKSKSRTPTDLSMMNEMTAGFAESSQDCIFGNQDELAKTFEGIEKRVVGSMHVSEFAKAFFPSYKLPRALALPRDVLPTKRTVKQDQTDKSSWTNVFSHLKSSVRGRLTFEEFRNAVRYRANIRDFDYLSDDHLHKVFKLIDKDKQNLISTADLETFLQDDSDISSFRNGTHKRWWEGDTMTFKFICKEYKPECVAAPSLRAYCSSIDHQS